MGEAAGNIQHVAWEELPGIPVPTIRAGNSGACRQQQGTGSQQGQEAAGLVTALLLWGMAPVAGSQRLSSRRSTFASNLPRSSHWRVSLARRSSRRTSICVFSASNPQFCWFRNRVATPRVTRGINHCYHHGAATGTGPVVGAAAGVVSPPVAGVILWAGMTFCKRQAWRMKTHYVLTSNDVIDVTDYK
ncbi:hypothetical protein FLM9_511 [Candidatus Synechococcus spongiarum]|uniref:Uncharacterized protein n=1 Tax=Candidatus Synechococcus spongiarum TaxID=431041 RepID=A0A161KJK4_9SYNE|nr:hypothetical protein FLM9_511 [Candidatus Synechococcus spongiarum]